MNLKKKLEDKVNKRKCLILSYQTIMLIALMLIFYVIYPSIRYDYINGKQVVGIENISGYNSYNIVDNTFNVIGDDPNFTITDDLEYINIVDIKFEQAVEDDIDIAVYYAKKTEQFSEKNVRYSKIKKGESDIKFYLKKNKYKYIRLDVEKDFILDKIELNGKRSEKNDVKFTISICIFLVIAILGAINIKNRYDKINAFLFKTVKQLDGILKQLDKKIEKIFTVVGIIMGCLFAVLIPPEQVPDEPAQYSMIENEFGFSGYYNEIYKYYEDIGATNVVRNYDVKQSKESLKKHSGDRFSKECKWTGKISIKMITHLPQGIAFFIFALLGAPIAVCMYAAEFAAVLFFVIIGYIALKIMPVKKSLLFAIMLLPMNLQQCSSVSYDAVLLPVCFLLTSYIFHLIYDYITVGYKQILCLGALSVVIMLIKPPYLLLLGLLLMLRCEKISFFDSLVYQKIKKFKYCFAVLIIFAIILGCILFRENMYVKVVLACVFNFKRYVVIVFNTLKSYAEFYTVSTIGIMGWLDTKFSICYYLFIIIFLAIIAQKDNINNRYKNGFVLRDRIIMLTIAFLIVVTIITIMFTWTFQIAEMDINVSFIEMAKYLNNTELSLGTQGRYFVPIVFLIYALLYDLVKIKDKVISIVEVIVYPIMFIYVIMQLLQRFWG